MGTDNCDKLQLPEELPEDSVIGFTKEAYYGTQIHYLKEIELKK